MQTVKAAEVNTDVDNDPVHGSLRRRAAKVFLNYVPNVVSDTNLYN